MQEIIPFFNNHFMLILSWVILFIIVMITIAQNRLFKMNDIPQSRVIRLINKEDAVVIDVRNLDDYRQGHITNSWHLAAADIQSGNLGELQKMKAKPVIVVCTSGAASRVAAQNLIKIGFAQVYVLQEGIYGWNREKLPLVLGK